MGRASGWGPAAALLLAVVGLTALWPATLPPRRSAGPLRAAGDAPAPEPHFSTAAPATQPRAGMSRHADDCEVYQSVAALTGRDSHCRRGYSELDHVVVGRWNPWPTITPFRAPAVPRPPARRPTCANWTVVTAHSFAPALCAPAMTVAGWCIVVVLLGAAILPPPPLPRGCHVLHPARVDPGLAELAAVVPANSPAVQLFGYLFAILHGAELILDTTAEALLALAQPPPVAPEFANHTSTHDTTRPLLNPRARDFFPLNCSTETHRRDLRRTHSCLVFLRHGSPHTALSIQQFLHVPEPDVHTVPTHHTPVFPPHGTLAPYVGTTTAFWRRAFWALWRPVHNTGTEAEVQLLRGYVAQRLQWALGGRTLFLPLADPAVGRQHKGADLRPAVARAVQEWAPRLMYGDVCEMGEDLLRHLADRRHIDAADVRSFALWCAVLRPLGLTQPDPPPPPPKALGAIVTLSPGTPRLKAFIRSWRRLTAMARYPVLVFHDLGTNTPEWEADLRVAAGPLQLHLYPVAYNLNDDIIYGLETQVFWPTISFSFNRYRGYMFCSQFLGYEVYRHPALAGVQYVLRLDDDVNVPPSGTTSLDLFADMQARQKRVGWIQWSRDHVPSRKMSGLYPLSRQFACTPAVRGFPLARTYNWTSHIENLNAGCVEAYHVDVFMNDHYFRFLMWTQMWHGMVRFYLEQAWKSVWLKLYVPPEQHQYYGCHLDMFHKSPKDRPRWFLRYGVNNATGMCGPTGWGWNATYQRSRDWASYLTDPPDLDVCAPSRWAADLAALRFMLSRCPPVDPQGPKWDLLRLLAASPSDRLRHMQECTDLPSSLQV